MKSNLAKLTARCVLWCASVAALVALASPVFAQTTGQIIGGIVDTQGGVIPGATMTATSQQLQGARTAVTDAVGQFRFPNLPPGTYVVKAELTGFQPVEQTDIRVGLDQTIKVNLKMQVASLSQTVLVQGVTPSIDTTTAAGSLAVGAEMFNQLAVRRDFYAISRLAPGTNEDRVGPATLGSTGAENAYIIEGLNMTGIERGEQAKTINFDFIQEINIRNEGLPSEYGRSTGGVIEAVTKSGGNAFHGSFFGYTAGGGLQAKDNTRAQRPQTTTQVVNVGHQWDAGFDVGGFLVKDKLWFFGAYNGTNERDETTVIRTLVSPGSPAINGVVPVDITKQIFAGKLTYNAANNQTLVFSLNGDPTKRDGNLFAIAGPSSTWQGVRKTGDIDYIGRYDGVFGNSWLVKAIYGRHNESSTYEGAGTTLPLAIDATVVPNALSGGFGFYQNQTFSRDEIKADLTKYLGSHTLKGGIDYENIDTANNSFQGGAGQRIYKFVRSGVTYYRHRYYVDDRAAGYVRSDSSTWKIANPLTAKPQDKNNAMYVQDSWKVLSNLSIDGGVRWERQNLLDRDQKTVIDLKKNWAGRFGVAFDPWNDGRGKIVAHYGRFYENIPLDINIRAFGGEVQCFCYNFSPNPGNITPDRTAPRASSLLGGSEPVDPNLKGQYIDEYLVGVEREVAPSLVVGARFNYRKLGRVIEDFLVPSLGDYFIANPGEGTLGQSLGFYDGESAPSPTARRVNKAFMLTARKRFTNNWQVLTSYVWSQLEGNYDGTFQNSTGQLDPNINSAFDYGDFLINAEGRLTNDRHHQFKFDGSYQFSSGRANGLNVGLSTRWLSGVPLTAYGFSFAYNNYEYYLTPRGSQGEAPADYEADLHVGYPIRLGKTVAANLNVDVFNLFNRQAISQLDQRYMLNSDEPCAGVPDALCNGDGGLQHKGATTNPIGQLSNVQGTAVNPDFFKAGTAFTGQRSIRLGIRLTF